MNLTQGSSRSLGRAFAEPELKFVEEPYKKPMLKFFEITKGKSKAGELLAAFELIELDYSGFGEVCLSVLLLTLTANVSEDRILRTRALKATRICDLLLS